MVAVLGPEVRGLSAAAAAKEAGAGYVMVTGLGPGDAERLALAPAFGADLVVDDAAEDPVRALQAATGGLADVVVDVTAKAPPPSPRRSPWPARRAPWSWPARGQGGAPGFSPTASCSRSCGCWVHWGSSPSPTGLRWTCWSRIGGTRCVAPAAHREPRRGRGSGVGDGR